MGRGSRRYQKWQAKTEPETTFLLLQKTRGLAVESEREYQPQHEELIRKVKAVLEKYGSEATRAHAYVWFAQGLWYAKKRYSSQALQKEANALFVYFYVLGLYEQALKDIALSFGITLPSPQDIVGGGGISEDVVYRGTKRALQETLERVETDLTDADIRYDASGNISQIIKTDKVTGTKKKITFIYDRAGNLVGVKEESV